MYIFHFRLQIEREELFLSVSIELAGALQWEERAKDILARKGQMSEFEDLIRFDDQLTSSLASLSSSIYCFPCCM